MDPVTDLFDLEAAMQADDAAARAMDRVTVFNALTPAEQYARLTAPCDSGCQIPLVARLARRPLD